MDRSSVELIGDWPESPPIRPPSLIYMWGIPSMHGCLSPVPGLIAYDRIFDSTQSVGLDLVLLSGTCALLFILLYVCGFLFVIVF